jgi:hypothetical protein
MDTYFRPTLLFSSPRIRWAALEMSVFQYFRRNPGGVIALLPKKEGTMHIHGNSMNVNAANSYSASNEAKSIAAQRAADVRKRLLKGAASVDEAASPEETLMIGKWLDSGHNPSDSDSEYHAASSGKDSDLG